MADLALFDAVITGEDAPLDPVLLDGLRLNGLRLNGLRLGIVRDYYFDGIDPAVAAVVETALERLAGVALEWTIMDDFLLEYCVTPEQRKTIRASAFSASLELVREGVLDLRQDRAFAPIWVRRKVETAAPQPDDESGEQAA